ncbi:MAG: 16S rRNA (cytosine(1402)-N(4))-methyltransferase RsmH [Bacilli bacterium]|nr:16S rRNA (cytosine(1402)-N(4))-methyltransferase RsmH [Bacilli bacterium]
MKSPKTSLDNQVYHIPVLLNECLENLNLKKDGIYVDATLGGGGHSYHILNQLSDSGHLYCFDQDIEAIKECEIRFKDINKNKFDIIHSNFRYMKVALNDLGIKQVDGILFDLGVSSHQLDTQDRGFSYNYDARLDMRMDQRNEFSAWDVVNNYSETNLVKIFYDYGEEKYARSIARKIVDERKKKPIDTTFELVEIIKSSIPNKYKMEKGHPAKRVFQAIRIEVNQELTILKDSLENALELLKPGGRLCVITFHSLEDKIVKSLFKEKTTPPSWNRNLPISLDEVKLDYRLISKKAIVSNTLELENNNRAHSAKLRVIERL